MTVGVPASPSPMISASKGTSPRYGTARSSLRALPPPTPNRPVVLGNAEHRDVERREHLGGFTGFGGRDARRLRHNYSTRELDCLRQTQRNVSRPWWKIHDENVERRPSHTARELLHRLRDHGPTPIAGKLSPSKIQN